MTMQKLDDLSFDELNHLIDEATNIRTTKFEGGRVTLEERRARLAKVLERRNAAQPAAATPPKPSSLVQRLV